MNRRGVLGFLLVAPIVGPGLLKTLLTAAPVKAAAPGLPVLGGAWQAVRFIEKEFDYGARVGYCLELRRPDGTLLRNAVRLIGHTDRAAMRQVARRVLEDWADEASQGRVGGFEAMQVLEGNETHLGPNYDFQPDDPRENTRLRQSAAYKEAVHAA